MLVPTKEIKTIVREQFKTLFEFNDQLGQMVDEIFKTKEIKVEQPKAAFTSFALGKAYKTHKAALILCSEGYGEDAAILVRSLFELLVTLLYVLKDSTNGRIDRYFAFDWVIAKKMFDYVDTKPEIKKEMEDRAINPKPNDVSVEEVLKQAKLAKEKYGFKRGDWSDKSIYDMAVEVGRFDNYKTIYALQSQIAHTAVRVMNEYVKDSGDGTGLKIMVGPGLNWVENNLVAMFDFYYSIIGECDRLFELGFDKRLDEIVKRYLVAVGELNNQPK